MLDITYRRPADLNPRARNPRTHSKKQIRQIAESIRRFGFTNPILVDEPALGAEVRTGDCQTAATTAASSVLTLAS